MERNPKSLAGIGPPERREEADGWLVTYLDVITLVLTFFVILLAFSDFTDSPTDIEVSVDGGKVMLPIDDLPGEIDIVTEEHRITLRISDRLLFPSGTATLTAAGREALEKIVPILQAQDHPVSIEGHTDNVPIATDRFPSNWELSSARATRVLRYIEDQGIAAERLRAIGHADSRPIADNDSEEGRARNRRVGIVIHLRE